MGSYDGAELCELTGHYIFDVLSNELSKEKIGLYHDDGLSCFQNMTGPQAGKVKKKICEIFQSFGLKNNHRNKFTNYRFSRCNF